MQDGLWQAVLGEIELTVSRGHYVTWFKNTRLLRHKDNILVVGVQNVFVKQQMERRFSQLIIEILEKNGVKPERIEFKIDSGIVSPKKDPRRTGRTEKSRTYTYTSQANGNRY